MAITIGIRSRVACDTILAAVAAAMIFFYGRIDPANEAFREWDLHTYFRMASAAPSLAPDVPVPFAYRIVGPYAVGLIPTSTANAFFIANLVLSLSFICLMYRFLRYLGLRQAFACVATVLYIFNKHFFGFTSWNYFHVDDVLANALFIVLFWSMLESRWSVFAIALLVGSATRETTFLMIPVGILYLLEERSLRREAGRFAGAIMPAILCAVAMRLLIHAAEGVALREAFAIHWTKITSVDRVFHILVNPFVPLTFVPLVFPGRTLAFFRDRTYLLLFFFLIAGTTLFGHNNERLLNPASIVFYPLVGFIMQDCVWPRKWMIGLILAGAFLSSFHWLVARYPLPSRAATIALSGGSTIVITAALASCRITDVMRSKPGGNKGRNASTE
ncbi:MAG: hypothetical protein PHD74_08520 [Candidatus Krumholzibacteria bacterium]|nr:hypothetical protein [Candidatus Krumholzibacteria bacterium]